MPTNTSAGSAVGVGRFALSSAAGASDLPLLECGGHVVTESEFAALVTRWQAVMADCSVSPGERVLTWADNSIGLVAAYLAVWDAGGVIVPLNPSVPAGEVLRIGAEVDPSVVIAGTCPEGDRAVDEASWVTLDGSGAPVVARLRDRAPSSPVPDSSTGNLPAVILYTSGTTGSAKGVLLSDADLRNALESALRFSGQGDGPARPGAHLCAFPLSHISGITSLLYGLRTRRPVVIMPRFSVPGFASVVARHRLKFCVLTPSMLASLVAEAEAVRAEIESLRIVRAVAAPLSETLARAAWDQLGIRTLNSYGLTETAGEVIAWRGEDLDRFFPEKVGSIGRPHAGVEIRVVEAETGVDCAPGEIGALWVKAPFGFRSYWDGGAAPQDEAGYLRTGDLARVDSDGFVWLAGRARDVINRGGFKVVPEEVEEVLRAHPGVVDAMVAGVPHERLGEVPVAFLVVTGPEAMEEGFAEKLGGYVKAGVAGYKVPVGYYLVEALPRTANGKIRRAEAGALLENGDAVALPAGGPGMDRPRGTAR
jgi:long-chain acyl-CoA synthetase